MKLNDDQILGQLELTSDMLEEIFEASAPRVSSRHMIGPYRLIEQVGRGSCGRVYRAIDTTLGRTVAVKLLADYASDLTEARKAVAVKHPNIVQVITADSTRLEGRNVSYIVYEFVDGPTLDVYLRGKRPRRRWEVCRQIAAGLRTVHDAGVAHGDVRTCNILVEDGRAKVTDFGCGHSGYDHESLIEPDDAFSDDIDRLAAIAGVRPRKTMAEMERSLAARLSAPRIAAVTMTLMLLACAAIITSIVFLQQDDALDDALATAASIEDELEASHVASALMAEQLESTQTEAAKDKEKLEQIGDATSGWIERLEALRAKRAEALGVENDETRQRSRQGSINE